MSGGNLWVCPWVSPLDNGAVVPNSKLTFTLSGTNTPSSTYIDSSLTLPNSNPIQADAEGVFGPIYLDPTITYRVLWTTAAGVQIRPPLDDIVGGQTTGATYRLKSTAPSLVFEETDATAGNRHWRINVNGEALTVDLGNDAESIWTTVLTLARSGILRLVDPSGVFGAKQVITGETGVFVGTLLGIDATVTGNISYSRQGSIVSLFLLAPLVGTSNLNQMTITGLPVALQPTNAKSVPCSLIDNTVPNVAGLASIFGGTISFYMLSGAAYSITGFTTSGSKGLGADWVISYPVDSLPA